MYIRDFCCDQYQNNEDSPTHYFCWRAVHTYTEVPLLCRVQQVRRLCASRLRCRASFQRENLGFHISSAVKCKDLDIMFHVFCVQVKPTTQPQSSPRLLATAIAHFAQIQRLPDSETVSSMCVSNSSSTGVSSNLEPSRSPSWGWPVPCGCFSTRICHHSNTCHLGASLVLPLSSFCFSVLRVRAVMVSVLSFSQW